MQREDSDKIGLLAYYPPNGTFNLMYYPYYGKKAQVLTQYSVHTKVHAQYTQSTVLILTCDAFTVSGELHSASSGREVPERLSEHGHQRGV